MIFEKKSCLSFIPKRIYRKNAGPVPGHPRSRRGRTLYSYRAPQRQAKTGIIGKIKEVRVIPATEQSAELYEITYETKYVELDLQYLDDRIAVINEKLAQANSARSQLNQQIQEQSK